MLTVLPHSRQSLHPRWGNSSRVIPSRNGSSSSPASIPAGAAPRPALEPRGFLLTPASAECLIINCISSSNCCSCRWSWTRHHKQLVNPELAPGRDLLSALLTSQRGGTISIPAQSCHMPRVGRGDSPAIELALSPPVTLGFTSFHFAF